jgi:hypothetical protein
VQRQKVFGIGFHKTGTSTLESALRVLGYTVKGTFGVDDGTIGDTVVERAIEIAGQYDAVQDNPWPLVFRDLDNAYPDSKFILTLRDTDRWWVSLERHFGGKTTAMRTWIYGVGDPTGHEEIYKKRYEAHNVEVLEYFKDRPGDMLVVDVTAGDGWAELCPFLGIDIPDTPFPHRNSHREHTFSTRVKRKLRKTVLRSP